MTDQILDSFIRKARLHRVVDGDTVILDIDLGFYTSIYARCRLYGIDASQKQRGSQAYLVGLFDDKSMVDVNFAYVYIKSHENRHDARPRWSVTIYGANELNFNEQMVIDGYAVAKTY